MHVPEAIADVVRSGFVESSHRASAVVVGASGATELASGDVTVAVSPRSASKPLQAVGMLRCGLDLPDELLALAAASHAGDALHRDGVRKVLAAAGLDENALGTPPAMPLDPRVAEDYLRAGGKPSALVQNCSGQHAAMLMVSVANGWPTDSYLEPDHPLQRRIAETLSDLTGEPIADPLIDGCGLPLFTFSLGGLARSYRTLVLAPPGSPERRVADVMRSHPEYVAGAQQLVTGLMRAVPGLLAKTGAEGVFAFALADGQAAALKVEDGSSRPVAPLVAALLDVLGVVTDEIAALTRVPVFGVDREVGEVRVRLRSQ